MNILLTGIEMPTWCRDCPLCWNMNDNSAMQWCMVAGEPNECVSGGVGMKTITTVDWKAKQRPRWCPLVELPPHGDLIDRDALYELVKQRGKNWAGEWCDFECHINGNDILNAPVIIPAEKDGRITNTNEPLKQIKEIPTIENILILDWHINKYEKPKEDRDCFILVDESIQTAFWREDAQAWDNCYYGWLPEKWQKEVRAWAYIPEEFLDKIKE